MQPGSMPLNPTAGVFHKAPPRLLEYFYYLVLFNSIFGAALGLNVPMLGAALTAAVAAFCFIDLGPHMVKPLTRAAIPLACACSMLAIQFFIHNSSISDLKDYIVWLMVMVIIHTMSLRPGFQQRFALAAFAIGLVTIPFMQVYGAGHGVERTGLDRSVGFANPNDLSAWFGYCAVYFIVLSVESRRLFVRLFALGGLATSIIIIGVTVSRAPLIAVAVAAIFALRRLLKRSFVPLLALALLGVLAIQSGLVERAMGSYAERGMEDTGRMAVLPLALGRMIDNPIFGVGLANVATPMPFSQKDLTPHNSFIFVGLTSGILPLALYIAYWMAAYLSARRATRLKWMGSPLFVPAVIYSALIALELNAPFTFVWMIVALASPLSASLLPQNQLAARRAPPVPPGYRVAGYPPQKPVFRPRSSA